MNDRNFMQRIASVLLVCALLGSTACAHETSRDGDATPIAVRGVWKITELAARTPGGEWVVQPTPHSGQFIFTDQHYSYLYVRGSAARKTFSADPNNPTDAEKAEAYNTFVAATGTYSLSGRTLTMTALVHKNPNEMIGEPLVYTVERANDTLRMITINPPFLPGREWRTVLTKLE